MFYLVKVLDALTRGLMETAGLTEEESTNLKLQMEKNGRIQTETWS